MRIKTLLGLAALAVGLSTSMAQVYSLNVVGYVNVTLEQNKLSFLSVPLIPANSDFNITNTVVAGDVQTDANLFRWAGTQWDTDVPTWYSGFGWYPDMVISNGLGFFVSAKANSTMTFVGEVPQGTSIPYNIPAGASTLANKIPVSASFPGWDAGMPDDNIFTWNQAGQTWDNAVWTYYADFGWNAGLETDPTNGPVLNPAQAVFYIATKGAISFSRSFTVQ